MGFYSEDEAAAAAAAAVYQLSVCPYDGSMGIARSHLNLAFFRSFDLSLSPTIQKQLLQHKPYGTYSAVTFYLFLCVYFKVRDKSVHIMKRSYIHSRC